MVQVPTGRPLDLVLSGEHHIRGNLVTTKVYVDSQLYQKQLAEEARINKEKKLKKKQEQLLLSLQETTPLESPRLTPPENGINNPGTAFPKLGPCLNQNPTKYSFLERCHERDFTVSNAFNQQQNHLDTNNDPRIDLNQHVSPLRRGDRRLWGPEAVINWKESTKFGIFDKIISISKEKIGLCHPDNIRFNKVGSSS